MKNESRRKLDSCYIFSCLTCKYGMRHFLGSPLEGANKREGEKKRETRRERKMNDVPIRLDFLLIP